MIDLIFDALSRAFQWFINLVVNLINGLIDFVRDIKKWFKSLSLISGRHTPFISRAKEFKEILKNAPVKNVGIFENENTIIEGVYDNVDDEIINIRAIQSEEGFDNATEKILGDEKLVILI